MTPHRSIQTGNPKRSEYSRARVSEQSLEAPYREMGGVVEKGSATPAGETPGGIELEGLGGLFERKRGERGNGVHPARAQNDETGAVALAIFKQVEGALEVMLE
jgi:hypothetical protein